jgi:hypothetical protein
VLRNKNEGDWVALYDNGTFVKVARIEHKLALTGAAAKTYDRNRLELLMIRHRDKQHKTVDEKGHVDCDYLIVDADTGIELTRKHNLTASPIPGFKNVIYADGTWQDHIDRQKNIYFLNDLDWSTLSNVDLADISHLLSSQFYKRENS